MTPAKRPYRKPKLRRLGALGKRTRAKPGGRGKWDNAQDKSLREMS